MNHKKQILAINGSASKHSSNLTLIKKLAELSTAFFEFEIIENLSHLPHFQTELSIENTPYEVIEFREKINNADGLIFCSPEYVFSIPSRLKNALEWCVSTTVFSDKPTAIITASASGIIGHEELQLILKTIEANFTIETTLLVQGIKAKLNQDGEILNEDLAENLKKLLLAFNKSIAN